MKKIILIAMLLLLTSCSLEFNNEEVSKCEKLGGYIDTIMSDNFCAINIPGGIIYIGHYEIHSFYDFNKKCNEIGGGIMNKKFPFGFSQTGCYFEGDLILEKDINAVYKIKKNS